MGGQVQVGHRNEVALVGRLSAPAQARTLPSGDEVSTWRLVVERPEAGRRGRGVDTVNCVAWQPRLRRRALEWSAGDVIEVEGALRRRFWRSPGGVGSRYEVEASRARRVGRTPG